jgi:hypothetical protein
MLVLGHCHRRTLPIGMPFQLNPPPVQRSASNKLSGIGVLLIRCKFRSHSTESFNFGGMGWRRPFTIREPGGKNGPKISLADDFGALAGDLGEHLSIKSPIVRPRVVMAVEILAPGFGRQ